MQRGDIDNTTPPRVYVVFEGTIAHPPEKMKGLSRKLFGPRLGDMQIDPEVVKLLWDRWQRLGVRFDAVTFAFPDDAVQELIDGTNLPIHTTWGFPDRETFVRLLPSMPWVLYVVDHAAPLAYGGRGVSITGVR